MPLYEYKCANCGETVDKRHGFDDVMSDRCEHCGGELKKTFNVAGIVFKGSGFYINDSRKSSGSSGSETSKKSASGSGESASSETKSEAKAETSSGDAKSETKKSDAAA